MITNFSLKSSFGPKKYRTVSKTSHRTTYLLMLKFDSVNFDTFTHPIVLNLAGPIGTSVGICLQGLGQNGVDNIRMDDGVRTADDLIPGRMRVTYCGLPLI